VNLKGLSVLLSTIFLVLFFSCTKINEATELGGDLIPAVDNVNTFDTTIDITAAYFPFNDSSKHLITDNMALGRINDPIFGTTNADMYFNLSSTVYGTSPFKDSVKFIDSVVLSLGYQGGYGDTSISSQVTVQVSEINTGLQFQDTVLYRFDHPGFNSGSVLGTKTFSGPQFKDSTRIGFKSDTTKVANVLRIRLNNSIGDKLKSFDATATGGFKNDSFFREKFRGFAVKTTNISGPGMLAYFNLVDFTKSALIVYYRSSNNGIKDTATATFVHSSYSQANSIKRTPGGNYLANLNQSSSQNLYIQSSPTGSYVGMAIPVLSSFPNRVIHRAELIAYKVSPVLDNLFAVPARLLLDHKGASNGKDSAYIFENDLQAGFDGSLNFASFGGNLRPDNSYRFNITRYVQGIVTRKERNDSLRLYAPYRSNLFAKNMGQSISIPNLTNIASGRVVVANGNFTDPSKRLRLRIIYSNL
jgi:hypothetical protein